MIFWRHLVIAVSSCGCEGLLLEFVENNRLCSFKACLFLDTIESNFSSSIPVLPFGNKVDFGSGTISKNDHCAKT